MFVPTVQNIHLTWTSLSKVSFLLRFKRDIGYPTSLNSQSQYHTALIILLLSLTDFLLPLNHPPYLHLILWLLPEPHPLYLAGDLHPLGLLLFHPELILVRHQCKLSVSLKSKAWKNYQRKDPQNLSMMKYHSYLFSIQLLFIYMFWLAPILINSFYSTTVIIASLFQQWF